MIEPCPLCYTVSFSPEIEGSKGRWLHFCNNCKLVFEERKNRPEREEETKRYLEHENGIQNEGYVAHLNQVIEPTVKYLYPGWHGLDFGCGPAPTLNKLVEQKGFSCELYDPIFYPELPQGSFDFVFATECFEHFFSPAHEIKKLLDLLNSGGILAILTQFWQEKSQFKNWWYANDLTHVVFYHEQTFRFIAENYGFNILEIQKGRVVILRKM